MNTWSGVAEECAKDEWPLIHPRPQFTMGNAEVLSQTTTELQKQSLSLSYACTATDLVSCLTRESH